MPRWLWILLGVLGAIALIIFIVTQIDVTAKEETLAALVALLS